jgi:hypothetical protein
MPFVRTGTAGDHGRERLRHDDDERNVYDQESDDRGHAEKMNDPRYVETAKQPSQLLKLARFPDCKAGRLITGSGL